MLEDNFSSGFIICTWSSLIIDIKLTRFRFDLCFSRNSVGTPISFATVFALLTSNDHCSLKNSSSFNKLSILSTSTSKVVLIPCSALFRKSMAANAFIHMDNIIIQVNEFTYFAIPSTSAFVSDVRPNLIARVISRKPVCLGCEQRKA